MSKILNSEQLANMLLQVSHVCNLMLVQSCFACLSSFQVTDVMPVQVPVEIIVLIILRVYLCFYFTMFLLCFSLIQSKLSFPGL